MILGIGREAQVFLYAGLSGMTVLFGYYILNCLRKIIPHNTFASSVEDLFFWIGASGYLFAEMYNTTYGSIRCFFLLGIICGALLGWAILKLGRGMWEKGKNLLEKYRKNR